MFLDAIASFHLYVYAQFVEMNDKYTGISIQSRAKLDRENNRI